MYSVLRVSTTQGRECCLTPRCSRRSSAWRLAREAPWFIMPLAGQAPCRCPRLNSNVRRHEGTMRVAAAIIISRSHGFALRRHSEGHAGSRLRKDVAWRFEPSEKSAPGPNSAASSCIVEATSPPTAATNREQPKSQFVEPAAGSRPVPSVACRTRGGRGRQQCKVQEVAVQQRASGVTPNPSFKRRATGVALGPRAAVVHHAARGPSATPLSPA